MESGFSRTSRGELLKRSGVVLAGLGAAGALASACGSSSDAASGTTDWNWLTWSDHYFNKQIAEVAKSSGIQAKPVLFTDDAAGYIKLRQKAPLDQISVDALWVTKEAKEGLLKQWDLSSIQRSQDLYSVAKTVPFWEMDGKYLVYPKGWSMSIIYYNPKYVHPAPDSWESLTHPNLKGKIVMENSASALLADAGVAIAAQDPTNMTPDELSKATDYLRALKPNVLALVSQGDQVVRALANESAWVGVQWLGTEYRVKAAGGPVVKPAIPKEGTTGWIDGECRVAASSKPDGDFYKFVNAMETPEWTAQIFLSNGHPMMNEKTYKVLVNQGHKEQADASFYNEPDRALQMTLWGPSNNDQAYTDAFNQVFGA